MAFFSIAVLNTVENGLGAGGEAIDVLRIFTKLIDGYHASQFSFHCTHSLVVTPETCGGTLVAPSSLPHSPPKPDPSPAHPPLPPPPSNSGLSRHPHQHHSAAEGHRTIIDALISFFATLSEATTFGDVVVACKVGGKLTVRLGRATYVMETGYLLPDAGAVGLVFLTKGLMEGLAREAEKV